MPSLPTGQTENKAASPRAELANSRVRSEPELLTHLFHHLAAFELARDAWGVGMLVGGRLGADPDQRLAPSGPALTALLKTAAWWAVVTPFLHGESETQKVTGCVNLPRVTSLG